MEQSMINFVKEKTLEDKRKDARSKFNELAIKVNCRFNNGLVKTNRRSYRNKCLFISIEHIFRKYNIPTIQIQNRVVPALAIEFMKIANFMDLQTMFDTDNSEHLICLQKLLNMIPFLQLQFFIGQQNDDQQWVTTPDPSIILGDGNIIGRILNKGAHFELILDEDEKFVYKPRSMTSDIVIAQQERMFQILKQEQLDRELAIKLSLEYSY